MHAYLNKHHKVILNFDSVSISLVKRNTDSEDLQCLSDSTPQVDNTNTITINLSATVIHIAHQEIGTPRNWQAKMYFSLLEINQRKVRFI